MRTLARGALGGIVAAATVLALVTPTLASPPMTDRGSRVVREDNHAGPLSARQEARRKAAQELILSGKASPNRTASSRSPTTSTSRPP